MILLVCGGGGGHSRVSDFPNANAKNRRILSYAISQIAPLRALSVVVATKRKSRSQIAARSPKSQWPFSFSTHTFQRPESQPLVAPCG